VLDSVCSVWAGRFISSMIRLRRDTTLVMVAASCQSDDARGVTFPIVAPKTRLGVS
jgi:hypothetical protein